MKVDDEAADNSTAPTSGPYKEAVEHVGEGGTDTFSLPTPVFAVASDLENAKEGLYVGPPLSFSEHSGVGGIANIENRPTSAPYKEVHVHAHAFKCEPSNRSSSKF